jgi:hypothetical protein
VDRIYGDFDNAEETIAESRVQRLWRVDCDRRKNALAALVEKNFLRLKSDGASAHLMDGDIPDVTLTGAF